MESLKERKRERKREGGKEGWRKEGKKNRRGEKWEGSEKEYQKANTGNS